MSRKPSKSEPTGREPRRDGELAVREQLEKIQRDKRAGVRWQLSRHTAERALVAIRDEPSRAPYQPSSKTRRRKRHKRLL
ncbi:MAG: hypothetical protein ACRENQ_16945 [Gemmatimonadaceae bacterium]